MGASTHHSTLQHCDMHIHGSTLQLSRHHTADSMSEAVRLPGETARLRALTLLHSHTHSMASQCRHSTHMQPILNASPVKSSPKASRTCSHNPLRCVLLDRSSRRHAAHRCCDPANSTHQQCGAQPPVNARTWSVLLSVAAMARLCSRWDCCAASSGGTAARC